MKPRITGFHEERLNFALFPRLKNAFPAREPVPVKVWRASKDFASPWGVFCRILEIQSEIKHYAHADGFFRGKKCKATSDFLHRWCRHRKSAGCDAQGLPEHIVLVFRIPRIADGS